MQKKYITTLILILITASAVLYYAKTQNIPISPPELDEIKEMEQVAFLQDGDLWIASLDNLENKRKIIDVEEKDDLSGAVRQYYFSPNGEEIFFLNNGGEIIKINSTGQKEKLITIDKNAKTIITEKWNSQEIVEYKMGQILDFWLSPDGQYIVYMPLESFEGCCMSEPTYPTGNLWIMKSDGTNKTLVQRPKNYPGVLMFDGWLPDSRSFLFHAWFLDEATQGRPFYEADVTDGSVKMFEGITYDWFSDIGYQVTVVALAEPIFSPGGDKLAYIKGGISGEEIWMADIDGTARIKLVSDFNAVFSTIKWSADGDLLMIALNKGLYIFNKTGKIVFYQPLASDKKLIAANLSINNTYIGTIWSNKEDIIFSRENISTKEHKEISMKITSKIFNALQMFVSQKGNLYYILPSEPNKFMVVDFDNNRVDIATETFNSNVKRIK